MGHKIVCLTCRKAFSNNVGYMHAFGKCQECNNEYIYFNHKFKPPKRSDLKSWEVVRFLYQNGFRYQHINQEYIKTRQYGYYVLAKYPTNLREAKEFANQFAQQAILH
jgi:uncharacterized protein YgiM (DUF1202 family)